MEGSGSPAPRALGEMAPRRRLTLGLLIMSAQLLNQASATRIFCSGAVSCSVTDWSPLPRFVSAPYAPHADARPQTFQLNHRPPATLAIVAAHAVAYLRPQGLLFVTRASRVRPQAQRCARGGVLCGGRVCFDGDSVVVCHFSDV